MKKIKRVPAEKLPEYLGGWETLAIEQDGKIVGFYTPRRLPPSARVIGDLPESSKIDPETRAAAERLQKLVQEICDRNGWTEEEFADLMNPKIEFPYDRFRGPPDREPDD
jgi:hypothetical protein